MRSEVRADELVVGDVVLLPTEHGEQRLRIREITPRSASIKFVGRRAATWRKPEAENDWGWGWPPDQVVTRVRKG